MNIGDRITIGGETAEVIKVRKTAPVAVVQFDDGRRWLHWYGDEPSAPTEECQAEPCAGREHEEAPTPHEPLEVDRDGGTVTCRDCGKSWTGHQPEHCTVCHETFGGTRAGDLHRIGKFGDPGDPRRCLNPVKAGLELGHRGHWSRPLTWAHSTP